MLLMTYPYLSFFRKICFYLDFVVKVRCILKISYKTFQKYLTDNNTKLDEYESIT